METTAFKTDKYELTMLQSMLESDKANKKAVFELFARKLPTGRRYGVVAGTGRAIEAVKNFKFSDEQIAYLEQDPVFNKQTIQYLKDFKFTGNIYGYNEGDVYFPYSPILTVESTFGEAVLLETLLLSILNHDSAVASAASRMVQAAEGLPIIEMGSRRTHESSAVSAARAAYLTGFNATSNLEAGLEFGIPTTGTSAHAFTLAHADEKDAFRDQVKALGANTTLLVDTYDIPQGIRNAVEVAGVNLGGIRIDSGDLYEETMNARILLDSLGAKNTKIVLSSDIDEFVIAELMERGTPFDGVGAGTRVVTGSGAPTAGMVYKLVAIEGEDGSMRSVAKKASGKKSIGGAKTAYRSYNEEGIMESEIIIVHNEEDEDVLASTLTENELEGAVVLEKIQTDYIVNGVIDEAVADPKNAVQVARKFHAQTMKTLPASAKVMSAGTSAFEAVVL